jgi:hypothetical protein
MLTRLFVLLCALVIISASPSGQWPDYKDPRATRTPDGKVDLNGPTPRMPDGKPDLSGVYRSVGRGASEPRHRRWIQGRPATEALGQRAVAEAHGRQQQGQP